MGHSFCLQGWYITEYIEADAASAVEFKFDLVSNLKLNIIIVIITYFDPTIYPA